MLPKKVFINYFPDNEDHKTWVRKLAENFPKWGLDRSRVSTFLFFNLAAYPA
jgi:hypothetical protein